MLSKLRNYSKVLIIIIVIAMGLTGFLGYGAFLTNRSSTKATAPSQYIATVNESKITQQDYYAVLRNQSSTTQLTSSQIVPFQLNVLNSMIDREVILQQAEEMGLEPKVSDEDVQEYLNELLEANDMTEEELVNNLQSQDLTLNDLKADLRRGMEESDLIEQVRESSYSNVDVSEEELAKAYEKVDLLVIQKNFGEDQANAEETINIALTQLEEGKDFAEVAAEYSDLNSSGNVGMISHDNPYVPEDIVAKAFEMEQEKLSEVITGENAYYIVKVMDKKLANGQEYEDAKAELKEQMLSEKQNEAFSNWLENQKAETEIVINDPLLRGYSALSQGDYAKAETELQKALESNKSLMNYVYLAQAYKENSKTDQAIELFEKAVAETPDNWETYYYYGNLLGDMGDEYKEEAIAKFDKAAELADEDFMAHYRLYIAYSHLGADEKAAEEMAYIQELNKKQEEERAKLEEQTKEEASEDQSVEEQVTNENQNDSDIQTEKSTEEENTGQSGN